MMFISRSRQAARQMLTAARAGKGQKPRTTAPAALAAASTAYPPTAPPPAWRPILSRPRAAASARLTRALIVGAYNRADAPVRAALAAAGWPAEGYGRCAS